MRAAAIFAAMIGGALLGVYLARSRREAPAAPSPAGGQDRMCPQLMATCADGSEVPTPCDCDRHGGMRQIGVSM
jgi:hypothetical protein